MTNKPAKISLWRILAYFIIYSFIGFIIETLFALINYNVLESRKSFLYGPFSGIYGIGAVIFILILRYFNKNNYRLFFAGCLVGTVTEYVINFIGEFIFNARWWDYSDKFLNINGRVCLLYTIFWGILSLLLIRVINPPIDKLLNQIKEKINIKLLKVFVIIGIVFMTCNCIFSMMALDLFILRVTVENNLDVANKERVIERYNRIYGNSEKTELIYRFWGNQKMLLAYPNVTIILEDGRMIWVKDLLPELKSYYYKF